MIDELHIQLHREASERQAKTDATLTQLIDRISGLEGRVYSAAAIAGSIAGIVATLASVVVGGR